MSILKDFFSSNSNQDDEMSANTPQKHDQHQWELLLRTYSPPRVIPSAENLPKDTLEKALFGFTTLFWECMVGKETKKEEILGSEQSQLDELIAKADQFGPQYFQRGSATYVVAKVPTTSSVVAIK